VPSLRQALHARPRTRLGSSGEPVLTVVSAAAPE